MSPTTVELSVPATSEELALLAAAAERRKLTLRDFLRLQILAAAKSAVRTERAPRVSSRSAEAGLSPMEAKLGVAFLP